MPVRLFADLELAARIEAAERALIAAGVEASREQHPQADVLARPIGSGLAAWVRPGSPLDKVVGLGFGGEAPGDDELTAMEAEYARRQAPVQIELSTLADPGLAPRLTDRGYRLVGFENVLGRFLGDDLPAPTSPGVTIEQTPIEARRAWVRTVVEGFAHPDAQGVPAHEEFPREAVEQIMLEMASSEGFRLYTARLEGTVAGGGSLRLGSGVAILCGAATLPDQRRRGVQTALLRHRLRDAREAGCDLAVVTTQPGSKSQQNVQREGFELLYTRAVLARDT